MRTLAFCPKGRGLQGAADAPCMRGAGTTAPSTSPAPSPFPDFVALPQERGPADGEKGSPLLQPHPFKTFGGRITAIRAARSPSGGELYILRHGSRRLRRENVAAHREQQQAAAAPINEWGAGSV